MASNSPRILRAASVVYSLVFAAGLTLSAQTNVLTQHNDIGRTGQNLTETILTPANVATAPFGKLFSLTVDGQVYAQPLYMSSLPIAGKAHRVLFVATEHDTVYAFDAASGGLPLWHASLLDEAHGAAAGATTEPASDTGCTNINQFGGVAEYGITSTPVIDPLTGTLYVVSTTSENGSPILRLHALDIKTGSEKFGGPVTIQASVNGSGSGSSDGLLKFDPKWQLQRAGLLLLNGTVYMGFGSICDFGPWHGWILAYNATSLAQTAKFVTTPNGSGSGVWMGGSGLAADVENNIPRMFPATGNGIYDAAAPYATNTVDYGDDILRLNLSNGMTVDDAFTPENQALLDTQDMDVGSGGVLILPDQPGASPHLLAQVGKSGALYLVNRDNLGGYNTSINNIVQQVQLTSGLWGVPAYWNENLYVWPAYGHLNRFPLTGGLLSHSPSEISPQGEVGPRGVTPSISANGLQNGIVWSVDWTQSPQVLYANDAMDVSKLLWSSAQNPGRDSAGDRQKLVVPTIADGNVFVGSVNQVSVYGLLPDFSLTISPPTLKLIQGTSAVASIKVAPSHGFTGPVTFSAAGLPLGVTFTTNTGSPTITLSAAQNAALGTVSITVTGTSGTLTHSLSVNLQVLPPPDFTLSTSTATLNVTRGSLTTSEIAVAPLNGFSGSPVFTISGLPAGLTASFSPVNSFAASTLTFAASVSAPLTASPVNITVTATAAQLVHSVSLALTVSNVIRPTVVGMTSALNVYGIFNYGASVTYGGLDNDGYAYSAHLLGTSLSALGLPFTFYGSGSANAFANTTVSLPAGNFATLSLLGTGVNGNQANQTFIVTYSDGTTSKFTQSLSDWGTPSRNAGETVVSTMAYRLTPDHGKQNGPWYLYGYSFVLNSAKIVKSVTLPNTRNVVVLSMVLSPAIAVNITSASNVYGMFNKGVPVTHSGLDNDGYAYSADLLGSSITALGVPFTFGNPGSLDSVANATILLPPGNFASLALLATGVNGNQSNQTFVVTYTDGTTNTFKQSVSDWCTPQNYHGETTVSVMPYRITPNGGQSSNYSINLYGYQFSLNSAKTVKSISLPRNRNVVLLAITVSQ
jgi:hypothetical protein